MTTNLNENLPLRVTSTLSEMALISASYLLRRKLRTGLTTLAIVFGVALIFAINVTLPSALASFKQNLQATSGQADLMVTNTSGESFAPSKPLHMVAAVKGVQAVTGELRRQITLSSAGSLGEAKQIQLVGVDPATAESVRHYVMSSGRFLQSGDTNNALLPAGIVDLVPDLGVGATLPLMTANGLQSYAIVGLVADKGNLYAPEIMVSLSDAQTALNQPGLINTIEVAFQPGVDRNAVTADVQKALGSNFSTDTSGTQSDIFASINLGYSMFNLMGFLALFLGAFLIFNTFRTVIVERRRDLAMLRAIGATRHQLTQMILVESFLQGVLGTVIGLVVGYFLATVIANLANSLLSQFERGMHLQLTLSWDALLGAIALGLLTTLAAGYWPARAASRISPLEALRPTSPNDVRRAARWGLIAGVVIMLIAVALLLLGAASAPLGAVLFLIGMVIAAPALVDPAARLFSPILSLLYAREGDLARGNLTRQPGRAAITASTLMIGLATLVMIAALVNSFSQYVTTLADHTFASDIVILPQTLAVYNTVVGADESLAERLKALPKIQTVASLRYASSTVKGQALEVLAIDPTNYPKLSTIDFVKGTPDSAFPALAAGRAAILNSLTAQALHVDVGGDFAVQAPDGPVTYRCVAIANDLLTLKLDAIYISQDNLKADFQKAEDVMILLNVKPGEDKTAALKDVQGIMTNYPQFTANLSGEYRAMLINLSASALYSFYVVALLILIPAALGLLNTLTINVLERTREIGILRAVGGSQKQMRRMVTAEALLLGLFGAAAGVLTGIAMSYGFIAVFDAVGWTMPYSFPFVGIIAAIIVGILLALFASILPARNAAKLDILRALQFE